MSLTFTDVFCGAGGSSIGLTAAGMELRLAANHWNRAIETHAANFRDADHLCADISNYDVRRLPSTDVGWFSPECTTFSPAGGRRNRRRRLEEHFQERIPDEAMLRSRATAWDVIRCTEYHRYRAVVVENVVEFSYWELHDHWLGALRKMGYTVQVLDVNAAHVYGPNNPGAPQWRDRRFYIATQTGIPLPDLAPRPPAWCSGCEKDVDAVQTFKKADSPGGKYRQQYVYRCPHKKCGAQIVEPYVVPALTAIDWTDLGQRIGDRKRPLVPNTMRRIEVGLERFVIPTLVMSANSTEKGSHLRAWPSTDPMRAITTKGQVGIATNPGVLVQVGGNTWERPGSDYVRAWPLTDPMNARTGTPGDAVAVPAAFIDVARKHGGARGIDEPLATIATARHHGLVTPFLVKNFGGNLEPKDAVKPVDEPFGTITTKCQHALVIPYNRTAKAQPPTDPLTTVTTKDRHAVVQVVDSIDVNDCHYRMLKPREHLRGQRFPDEYVVTGNKGEQTMQAGNAVPCNVSYHIGSALTEAMDQKAAA